MTAARRIAVATGSRADFGLLNPVMIKEIVDVFSVTVLIDEFVVAVRW